MHTLFKCTLISGPKGCIYGELTVPVCDFSKLCSKYGPFAIEREETTKKIKFTFICQIWFLGWNISRIDINLKIFFPAVSFLFTAKGPYILLIHVWYTILYDLYCVTYMSYKNIASDHIRTIHLLCIVFVQNLHNLIILHAFIVY